MCIITVCRFLSCFRLSMIWSRVRPDMRRKVWKQKSLQRRWCVCVCMRACAHVQIYIHLALPFPSYPVILLLAVQQYDLERLKKDGDAEKEREATLLEERWGSGVTHECACCMCVVCCLSIQWTRCTTTVTTGPLMSCSCGIVWGSGQPCMKQSAAG